MYIAREWTGRSCAQAPLSQLGAGSTAEDAPPPQYGRRKLFCIECYTQVCTYRTSCQVQPLQQRDAHKLLTVADVVLYAPYTGPSSWVFGRSVQHRMRNSMQNTFLLRYVII